jgi:periplasmic protein TonB
MATPARADQRTGRRKTAGMRHAFLLSSAGHLLALAACLLLEPGARTAPSPASVDVVLVAAGVEGGAASAGPGRSVSHGAPAPHRSAPEPLRTGYGLRAERPPPPERPARRETGLPPGLTETVLFRPESLPDESPAATKAPPGDGSSSTEERAHGTAPAGAADVPEEPVRAAPAGAVQEDVREVSEDAGDPRGPISAGKRRDGGGWSAAGASVIASAPADILRGGSARGKTGGVGDGAAAAGLRDAIQARIVYPDEAVRRGLEGEVLLRIRIDKGGNPGEIRVARSSGVRILDEAARRGVVRAAPLPSAPGWFEVPIRFSLR